MRIPSIPKEQTEQTVSDEVFDPSGDTPTTPGSAEAAPPASSTQQSNDQEATKAPSTTRSNSVETQSGSDEDGDSRRESVATLPCVTPTSSLQQLPVPQPQLLEQEHEEIVEQLRKASG